MNAADRLNAAVTRLQNPTVAGLDTMLDYIPYEIDLSGDPLEKAAEAIFGFNKGLIDALFDIVPAVKLQIAFYELYGLPGLSAFKKTRDYAASKGMVVITDAKRGDIGSTAKAYSAAFLGNTAVGENKARAFESDFLTVNPYFGTDGIQPFVDDCAANGKGIFVLVKTSNPSGGELQDLIADGMPVYEHVGRRVMEWGEGLIGDCGYSSVGAVVGATYPEQGKRLRELLKTVYFLVPGYGAQGAKGADLAGCFDSNGRGAIVNASRSIMCAYKKHPGADYAEAARTEALRMREDIMSAVGVIK